MKAHQAQAILLCLSLLSACGGGSFAPGVGGLLRSIQITPSQPSIPLGLNQQFTATAHLRNGSTKDITASAVWASSNTSVAAISGPGFAASRATGSATITATLSGVAGFSTLTVTQAVLVSITITPASPVLFPGTLQQFTATGTFSDHSMKDITGSVTWASSNDNVASIGGGGLATALALGSLTISATSGSVSASATVNVQPAVLSSIVIRPGDGKIAQLTNQQFQAIGTYTDGSTHNVTGKASWTSSNTAVATIAKSGLASGLAPGTTTITATVGSISASATLNVTNATIVSISVRPSGRTITPGTRLPFNAVGLFSDNSTQVITRNAAWSSNNLAVATMVRGGNTAIAVGPGAASISATWNGVSGSTTLNVSSATLLSISITPATAVLAPTTSVSCVATGTFSDGTAQVITNGVTWSSSSSTVASVDAGGRVTANSGGSAIITAQVGSVQADSTITVDSSQLTSIEISPPTASIAQQTSVAFQAIGTFADGNTQDLTTFAGWTSSQPSVATINVGHASGLQPGTTTIVALFDGQAGSANLTVTSASRTSLVASPAATNFEQGVFTQLMPSRIAAMAQPKDFTRWVTEMK
jgi:uncharacterized protein YjdB